MAVTYAFSINTFIDDIGAYAGFAAAIGLALFALLLFAQARELKRLREWGAHAHDRLADVERRLAGALELARRANAPAARAQATGTVQRPPAVRPLGRQPGAPVPARTSAPSKLPLLPAAPAGVGGPALASATVLVPLPASPPGTALPGALPSAAPAAQPTGPGAQPVAPTARPAGPGAQPGAPAAVPAVPGAHPTAPAAQPAPAAPAPLPGATPPSVDVPSLTPATAAAASAASQAPPAAPATGNGHAGVPPATLPPQRPAGQDLVPPARPPARPAVPARPGGARPPARPGQRPVRSSSARPAAAAPLRQRTPSATPRSGGAQPPEAPPARRGLLFALAGVGALVVAVVAVIALTSGGDDGSPSNGTPAGSTGSTQTQQRTTAAPPHGQTTVAVLNGTPSEGLAATAASQLVADGFVRGTVTNASSQDRPITVVSYYGGHEAEAAEVAKTLGVPSDAVEAIDPDTEAVVCSTGAGTCPETVVVTVGADRQ